MWLQACIWLITSMLVRGTDIDGWDELISVAPFTSLDLLFGEVDHAADFDRQQDCAGQIAGRDRLISDAINHPIPAQLHLIDDDLSRNQLDAYSALMNLDQAYHVELMAPKASPRDEQVCQMWTYGDEGQPNFGPGEFGYPGGLWLNLEKGHHLDNGVASSYQDTKGAAIFTTSKPGHVMANTAGRDVLQGSGAKASRTKVHLFNDCTDEQFGITPSELPATIIQDPLERSESILIPHVLKNPLSSTIPSDNHSRQVLAGGTWHLEHLSLSEVRQPPEKLIELAEDIQSSH